MKALHFERNLPRFAAARVLSSLGSGRGAGVGPLRLLEVERPSLPAEGWFAIQPILAGICGSDLATVDGRSSRYFEDIVSFPFTPGHEVVGRTLTEATMADGTTVAAGTKVVLEPVLGCAARDLTPACEPCQRGDTGCCARTGFGHLRPGLQTGFCADTGGGWSEAGLVAHHSQLHALEESYDDRDAVTVEPMACALHAVLGAPLARASTVAVLGAGTIGLGVVASLTFAADRQLIERPSWVLVGARYPHQRALATRLGADEVVDDAHLLRAVRLRTGSLQLGGAPATGQLTGGAQVVFDCVGSAASIAQALKLVAPQGTIVLVGMPGQTSVDLTSLWHREVRLQGAYAYGTERTAAGPVRTFPLAIELAAAFSTGQLVSATYPLERYEEALAHAGAAGRRGATKICFQPALGRAARKDGS